MYQSGSDPAPAATATGLADAADGAALSTSARGFINELVQAMQAAAEHQREATNGEVETMTRAHLERVRTRAAAEAEELRRMAQTDIDEIHAWQEIEANRVREEAARRIVARGEELDDYLVRHAALIDREVDQIEDAVKDYQTQLDGYFGKLTSEDDPGEIARLADELPPPPDLSKVGGEARAKALAEVAAEDAGTFSPEGPGPALVPVMEPKPNADPAADGGTSAGPEALNGSNGTNGSNGAADKTNPAIRLLRSIATLATPPANGGEATKATAADTTNGNGTAAAAAETEPATPVTTPVDDIAIPATKSEPTAD